MKMIVMDLDGTLLTDAKEIDEITLKSLITLKDWCYIVLASARGFYRIESYVKQLQIDNDHQYSLSFNGSVISDNLGNKLIDNYINSDDLMMLLSYFNDESVQWYLYYEDGRVLSSDCNVCEVIKTHKIYKLVCYGQPERVRQIASQFTSLIKDSFAITFSEEVRFEMVASGMNKKEALEYLANYVSISPEDIIAFGDGENDIEMLQYAGLGVAMGNSNDLVKSRADKICADNDHHGIADVLQQLDIN